MGGGLMQLVAYGSQDVYLTGNPQITFWKVVYRRHTNFALESVKQDFNGTVRAGSSVVATISRNGDLIHKSYLVVTPNDNVSSIADVIDSVELEIGGQQIDKHLGSWMDVWNELSLPKSKRAGWESMTKSVQFTWSGDEVEYGEVKLVDSVKYKDKDDTELATYDDTNKEWTKSNASPHPRPNLVTDGKLDSSEFKDGDKITRLDTDTDTDTVVTMAEVKFTGQKVYIPLEFFFCTNPGLALPLIALQYHEVRLKFKLGDAVANAELWVDYVYLDTDERRRMAQSSHEFLITQVQHQDTSQSGDTRLNFNHPCKELVWRLDGNAFGNSDTEGMTKLTLNGHERAAPRGHKYFNRVQPFQHHTCIPGDDKIGVYSFALKPEDSQPSGSCNFSRIDNAQLKLPYSGDIWATNWNVLRIMSGMGGLAYSN